MPAQSRTAPYTPFYCEENVYQLLASLEGSPRFSRSFAVFVSNLQRRALLFQQQASRQGADQGHYVLWDYHVVAVAVERDGGGDGSRVRRSEWVVVLDRDSRLGDAVPLQDYVLETFRPDLFDAGVVDPSLRSRFRVVPAQDFLANFASDRSHMLVPPFTALDAAPLPSLPQPAAADAASAALPSHAPSLPQYIKPIPPYPAICGALAAKRGETHNLWTRFLDMRLPRERNEAEARVEEGGFGTVLEGAGELLAYPW